MIQFYVRVCFLLLCGGVSPAFSFGVAQHIIFFLSTIGATRLSLLSFLQILNDTYEVHLLQKISSHRKIYSVSSLTFSSLPQIIYPWEKNITWSAEVHPQGGISFLGGGNIDKIFRSFWDVKF